MIKLSEVAEMPGPVKLSLGLESHDQWCQNQKLEMC